MIDFRALQKRVYQNKVNQGFNITDVPLEFSLTYGELAEAFEAWRKKKGSVGEELADVLIYLMGLSEILGGDREEEILRKIEINEKRRYVCEKGVLKRVVEKGEQ